MTASRPVLALLALLSLPAAGCAADATGAAEGPGAEESALSASSRSYVFVRRDVRKCAAPRCGGYWVRDANRQTPERYVSHLDLAPWSTDDDAQAQLLGAADGELVLRGKLGPLDAATDTRGFIVSEAWRGLPGIAAIPGDTLYRAPAREPAIQCFAAPCNNVLATKMNTTQQTSVTGLTVDLALPVLGDADWLVEQVVHGGALVEGLFLWGEMHPAGRERILDASQVYLRLPLAAPSCPAVEPAPCEEGTVLASRPAADGCLVPDGCVAATADCELAPACDDAYARADFVDATGCAAARCYPAF